MRSRHVDFDDFAANVALEVHSVPHVGNALLAAALSNVGKTLELGIRYVLDINPPDGDSAIAC